MDRIVHQGLICPAQPPCRRPQEHMKPFALSIIAASRSKHLYANDTRTTNRKPVASTNVHLDYLSTTQRMSAEQTERMNVKLHEY